MWMVTGMVQGRKPGALGLGPVWSTDQLGGTAQVSFIISDPQFVVGKFFFTHKGPVKNI